MDVSGKVRGSSSNLNSSNKRHSSDNRGSSKNYSKQKKKNTNRSQEKKLEQTTRIRIDQERLEDSESLDTSFLEGRLGKKVRDNRLSKEKLLSKYEEADKSNIFKRVVSICFLIVIILFIISFIPSLPLKINTSTEKQKDVEESAPKKVEKAVVLDNNYLFVGDYYTDGIDKNEFTYPIVKECNENYQTIDLLNDMDHIFYQYNPSLIFIEIGMNDLREDVSEDEILDHIREIIDKIQENRPYARIVIESIYPINSEMEEYDSKFIGDSLNNEDIQMINSKIQKIAKEKKVEYLDVYQVLSEEEQLKENYTEDGIHLNEKGYQRLISLIQDTIEDLS